MARILQIFLGMMTIVVGGAWAQTPDRPFFLDVQRETVEISGIKVRFPIRYYENIQISAGFCVPLNQIRPLVPAELEIALVQPKTTVLIMAASQFRHVEGMEPYNQFGIFVPVTHKTVGSAGIPGYFVMYLPASSEKACRAAIDIFGLPKFLAKIEFVENEKWRHCSVHAANKHLVTFSVKKSATKARALENYCYSRKKQQLLSYRLQSFGPWQVTAAANAAQYTLGDHPIACKLKKLQIAAKPISCFYSPKLQSVLYKPTIIGRLK